jgi:hypothetical protein
MSTAEQPLPLAAEPLSWAEICASYPDQFVCLVDIAKVELRSPEIKAACVVGHGPTHDAAFEPIRGLDVRYPRFAIRFTGACFEPLIRPSLVIDHETLELLRSRPRADRRRGRGHWPHRPHERGSARAGYHRYPNWH